MRFVMARSGHSKVLPVDIAPADNDSSEEVRNRRKSLSRKTTTCGYLISLSISKKGELDEARASSCRNKAHWAESLLREYENVPFHHLMECYN